MGREINFIEEMRAFDKWVRTNSLPVQSQLLWYKMFMLFNDSGWAEWIQVENLELMVLVKMKREATFIEHRNNLLNAYLIEYKKGKKGFPNKYRYITFKERQNILSNLSVYSVVQSEVQTVVYSGVETEVNTVDINKLNKTKQNKNNCRSNARAKENPFNPFKHFQRVFATMPSDTLRQELIAYSNQGISDELVCYMIDRISDDRKPWKYAQRVLDSCVAKGIHTVDAFKQSELQYSKQVERQKEYSAETKAKKNRFANYEPHERDFDKIERMELERQKRLANQG